MRIPAGTSSHSILTLSERGFKRLDSYRTQGDHFVHLKIKIPVNLSDEQKEILLEYAATERDTPGTVNGVDQGAATENFRRKKEEKLRQEIEEELTRKQEARAEKEAQEKRRREQAARTEEAADLSHQAEDDGGFLTKLKKKIFG